MTDTRPDDAEQIREELRDMLAEFGGDEEAAEDAQSIVDRCLAIGRARGLRDAAEICDALHERSANDCRCYDVASAAITEAREEAEDAHVG